MVGLVEVDHTPSRLTRCLVVLVEFESMYVHTYIPRLQTINGEVSATLIGRVRKGEMGKCLAVDERAIRERGCQGASLNIGVDLCVHALHVCLHSTRVCMYSGSARGFLDIELARRFV